jgi:hypothetical protein
MARNVSGSGTRSARCAKPMAVYRRGGGGLLHIGVLGREEERVLAEALWSRPRSSIGCVALDLEREFHAAAAAASVRAASSAVTAGGSGGSP